MTDRSKIVLLFAICGAGLLRAECAFAEGAGAGGNAKAEACEEAYQRDDYDAAATDCQGAIAATPALIGPYVRLAAIDIGHHQFDDALALMESASRFASTDEEKLQVERYKGLALYNLGRVSDAIPLLEDVARAHPEAFDVQLCIGQRAVKVGDGTQARIALERYFQYRPDKLKEADHDIRYFLAAAYVLENDWAKAQEAIDVGLREQPSDMGFKLLQADVYQEQAEWSRAVAVLEPILPTTTGARHALIAYKLATCYAQLAGRKTDAVAMAQQFLEVFPSDAKGYLLLGDVYAATSDYQQALLSYQTAQKYAPAHDVAILVKVGQAELALGKLADAEATLKEAATQAPDDLPVLFQLGRTYLALASWNQAIATLEHAVSLKPDHISEASDLLGRAYIGAGRLDDAQAAYQIAYDKSRGGDTFSVGGLVYVLNSKAIKAATSGGAATAETLLGQALALDPSRLETNRNLAVVALLAGKPDDALAPLDKVLARVRSDLVANRLYGRALLAKGDGAGAAKYYDTAMSQALRSGSGAAIAEVESEQAALFVGRHGDGDLDRAIAALDDAAGRPGVPSAMVPIIRRARALAYAQRGLAELKARKGDAAAHDLGMATSDPGLLTGGEPFELRFALGLAELEAGHAQPALDAFRSAVPATSAKGSATASFLASPYDKLGPEFFTAYAEYRLGEPRARDAAATVFAHLLPHAAAGEADLLRQLLRSTYELSALDAYQAGAPARALDLLHTASRFVMGPADRTIAADSAAIDLALAHPAAPAELAGMAGDPPEMLIDLGIYWDRQHDPRKAYDYFKQAAAHGARADHLGDWISALQREFNFDSEKGK